MWRPLKSAGTGCTGQEGDTSGSAARANPGSARPGRRFAGFLVSCFGAAGPSSRPCCRLRPGTIFQIPTSSAFSEALVSEMLLRRCRALLRQVGSRAALCGCALVGLPHSLLCGNARSFASCHHIQVRSKVICGLWLCYFFWSLF